MCPGILLFKRTPPQIEIMTENKDRLKYLWTQETTFVDWKEKRNFRLRIFTGSSRTKVYSFFSTGKRSPGLHPLCFR